MRRSFDAHALQRGPVRDGRHDQSSIVLEADEATIEEVIDPRGEEQAILAVQSLLVGGIPPWLAMTCHQVRGVFDAGDPASASIRAPAHGTALAHASPERARADRSREWIGLLILPLDPRSQVSRSSAETGLTSAPAARRADFRADQPEQYLGEQLPEFQPDRSTAGHCRWPGEASIWPAAVALGYRCDPWAGPGGEARVNATRTLQPMSSQF